MQISYYLPHLPSSPQQSRHRTHGCTYTFTFSLSPGTGRTGVFIALDISMVSYEESGAMNILNTVHEMRCDRGGMVQTRQQYEYIYKVAYEYAKMLNNPLASAHSSMSSMTSFFQQCV